MCFPFKIEANKINYKNKGASERILLAAIFLHVGTEITSEKFQVPRLHACEQVIDQLMTPTHSLGRGKYLACKCPSIQPRG